CIEKEPELGGTCLRIGCIPTKAWVQTAFFLKEAEESFAKLGIKISEPTLDFATANEWKAAIVKQMTSGVASLFKANGVEWVKGIEMLQQLISQEDADAAKELAKQFEKRDLTLHRATSADKVEDTGSGLVVHHGGETTEADLMLVATGRGPTVANLGLEEIGVELDTRKGIAADEHRRTTVPHIYAVGDCAGYWQLAHTAFREGEVAAENAM